VQLWEAVQEAICHAVENLKILEIDCNDLIAIGITNQRETTLLWNKKGKVFNLLCTADERLLPLKSSILSRTRNKKNYLRSVCGLPLHM
jgi:glycerol kinase